STSRDHDTAGTGLASERISCRASQPGQSEGESASGAVADISADPGSWDAKVSVTRTAGAGGSASEIPSLRLADEEVAESLHPGHRLEFFRIDEIGVERDGLGVTEQLHQSGVLFDDVVGQHGDAEAGLARPSYPDDVVDDEVGTARPLAVA